MALCLKATFPTYLKKQAIDASELSSGDKKLIKPDYTLDVAALEFANGHYEVELSEPIEALGSKLYLYHLHWGLVELKANPVLSNNGLTNAAVERQITRLKKYLRAGKTLDLNTRTKYFSQRDNYTQPHRTCNSSANAIYLDWLLRVTGVDNGGLPDDNQHLQTVLSIGDTIYHAVQTAAIKKKGFNTKWMMDADLSFIEALVDKGFPVVVNLLHRGSLQAPRGGHVIVLIGRNSTHWITQDPYGTLSSDYQNFNGRFAKINESEFKLRWQGGYRILA